MTDTNDSDYQAGWASAVTGEYPKCQCGAASVYKKEPNYDYLHSSWCPLYLSPNWLDELNKNQKDKEK